MTYAFEVAALNTVADYDGGAKALGLIVDINGSVLAHKVALTDKQNQLTVPQARKIMQATGDYRMLHGLAGDLSHLCTQVDAMTSCGVSFEKSLSAVAKEFGEYVAAASVAVADGLVTPNEMLRIDKELIELVLTANQLRARCALTTKPQRGRHG